MTYLAHWGGRLTGIPRFVSEIVRRSAGDADAVFVTWEKSAERFVEVDPVLTVQNHGRGVRYRTEDRASTRALRTFRWFGIGFAARVLRAIGRRARLTLLSRAGVALTRVRHRDHREIVPAEGDIFLALMGEWHDQSYIDAVTRSHAWGARVVQCVYDLLPIVTPHSSGHSTVAMTSYLTQVMPAVDLVLAISESTRRDLQRWLEQVRIPVPRIEVFRLGDDFGTSDPDGTGRGTVPPGVGEREYVLCVGTVEARKNHTLLYYVYRLAESRGIALPDLVIVGRAGYRAGDVFELLRSDPKLSGRVHVLDDIDDVGLRWLYGNCRFTVYPSVYEGWGLPIAESLAWGKPVITSATSSMPEIAGELVDYVDPFSPEECLRAIQRLMDDAYLKDAVARVNRYRPTSWDDTFASVDRLVTTLES